MQSRPTDRDSNLPRGCALSSALVRRSDRAGPALRAALWVAVRSTMICLIVVVSAVSRSCVGSGNNIVRSCTETIQSRTCINDF